MACRVAIVDDSRTDAGFVEELLVQWAADRHVAVQTEQFHSAESFLFRYAEDKAWDILLLDIEMGAMDGVTMAKRYAPRTKWCRLCSSPATPIILRKGMKWRPCIT